MRTTIDLPDPVFRRMKAKAALDGQTLREFVLQAVENQLEPGSKHNQRRRIKLPLIKGTPGHVIRPLSREQIDDLMFG